jgi:hypothetical protein
LRLENLTLKNEAVAWRNLAEKLGNAILSKEFVDPNVILPSTLWEIDRFKHQVEKVRQALLVANEPQVMDADADIVGLIEWLKKVSTALGALTLNEDEIMRLSITRGTLTELEKKEIENHVAFTYKFLSQIAWTEKLCRVPQIAHGHHEKLDGTGYPLGLKGVQIPIQSQLMTIADIYDALTALDRPYKKAVNHTRSIDILHYEASLGKIDKDLLDIFVAAEIYKSAHYETIDPSKRRKA